MVNYLIREYSEVAQKELNAKHYWVCKVIHWELCKRLKFYHTTKWYIHKPDFVQENETHEISLDFEVQTDPLISARSNLVLIN